MPTKASKTVVAGPHGAPCVLLLLLPRDGHRTQCYNTTWNKCSKNTDMMSALRKDVSGEAGKKRFLKKHLDWTFFIGMFMIKQHWQTEHTVLHYMSKTVCWCNKWGRTETALMSLLMSEIFVNHRQQTHLLLLRIFLCSVQLSATNLNYFKLRI